MAAKGAKRVLLPVLARRKFKFRTPAEMQQAVDQYFYDCVANLAWLSNIDGAPESRDDRVTEDSWPSISGLAEVLGTRRAQILKTAGMEDSGDLFQAEYARVVQQALGKIEAFLEQRLIQGNNVTGVIFALKNNFGWREKEMLEDVSDAAITVVERTIVKIEAETRKVDAETRDVAVDGGKGVPVLIEGSDAKTPDPDC